MYFVVDVVGERFTMVVEGSGDNQGGVSQHEWVESLLKWLPRSRRGC
jgi:hypothetical protein